MLANSTATMVADDSGVTHTCLSMLVSMQPLVEPHAGQANLLSMSTTAAPTNLPAADAPPMPKVANARSYSGHLSGGMLPALVQHYYTWWAAHPWPWRYSAGGRGNGHASPSVAAGVPRQQSPPRRLAQVCSMCWPYHTDSEVPLVYASSAQASLTCAPCMPGCL